MPRMKTRQIIGDNVRCLRYKLNWSQEKLGSETGLHQDYIGRLERGQENISVDNLVRIALTFKVPPYCLLIEQFCNGNIEVEMKKPAPTKKTSLKKS
jgi:transcriptional regulator with XRE-family HTH domain